jgi:2',3'-cyclic-nucleotide 2'-phosphodiesterase (5'-nucleotidase family)
MSWRRKHGRRALLCWCGGGLLVLLSLPVEARSQSATRSAVDKRVPDDPATAAVIAPFGDRVRALENVIGTLDVELKKKGVGGGTLGNFVVDALRARAAHQLGRPVALAVTNNGGLRRNTITPGPLRAADIYELLPFENALVTLDLTGEQLRRFLQVVIAQRDAQSGAVLTYRRNAAGDRELTSVALGPEGKEIDSSATYTLLTIDYLVKRGGSYGVLQEGKNLRPLNLTMRDAVLDYVKAEAAAGRSIKVELDGRFRAEDGAAENDEGSDE